MRRVEKGPKADARSEGDWLHLAEAVNSKEKQRFCLEQVLTINCRNALARRKLETLEQDVARSPLLHLATAELEVGNKEKVRQLLEQVLRDDSRSEHGWL